MNKSTYRIVYSDIKGKPPAHLPIDCKTKFRSFKRATKLAHNLHKEGRDVVLLESDANGFIASWELTAFESVPAFEFNESRTDLK